MDLWTGAEFWQVQEMAKAIPVHRRREIRELIYIAHAEPKLYLASLDACQKSKADNLAALADQMGNHKAAAEIRRNVRLDAWRKGDRNGR